MADAFLHEFRRRLTAQERSDFFDGLAPIDATPVPVTRNSDPIALGSVDDLMKVVAERQDGDWAESRSESDRWLAPRLHYALRLPRRVAASQGLWQWLALRYPDYVEWRWSREDGVTDDRWFGPVHKQAFARLWWGAELFRGDGDYSPVTRAFVRQDLINSFLHRPISRCRPLALGILDVIAPGGRETEVSSGEVNDLARVLNLATAGAPPEADTSFRREDIQSYTMWLDAPMEAPDEWDTFPPAPPCPSVSDAARAKGVAVARRAWTFTHASE